MSYAGILATVNFYKTEKAQLTGDLSDILMNLTSASRRTSELIQKENEDKSYIRENYIKESDSENNTDEQNSGYEIISDSDYDDMMDEIKSEFEVNLQDINAWESELEQQKQNKETQVQATGSYLDSFMEVLKNNIKKDFTYGQGK